MREFSGCLKISILPPTWGEQEWVWRRYAMFRFKISNNFSGCLKDDSVNLL
ncbi:hypothetical protein [Simonsiella muelleri]|uniref:hypothetical protein n=1 Tax=Simonsiella muelleri TaxID=72 RepID=UPI0023F018A3|nr:hypothetical protein [Simonsiella muelleri]